MASAFPSLPETIGRYRITRKLGEGGMGVVYAAQDERLGRAVAIKMMREAFADPRARERFWREARTAASVNHPNVCQLYEIGEADGELFIAMELLEGEPLTARMARGPLPMAEAAQLALSVLGALETLHRRGIVHRDLKPANIFLTSHGVKLMDFGLARPQQQVEQTASDLTLAGTVMGSPRYMAPEQARGEAVDARSDLFAVGVILYEILTGKPLFSGKSAVDILHSVVYDQPPGLTGSPAIVALDRIIQRALAKQPAQRYQQAGDMAQDIRAALLLVDSGEAPRIQTVTRMVVLPFRLLRPDPEIDFLAFSLADAIGTTLSALESLVVRSSMVASRYAGDVSDLKTIASEADVNAVVTGTLLRAGNKLRVTAQMLQAPEGTILCSHTAQVELADIFELQDDLARRIVEALPLTAREQHPIKRDTPINTKAYEFYLRANELSHQMQDLGLARDLYLKCLEEDPRYAPAWARLGRVYRVTAKFLGEDVGANMERAEQAFRRALEINPDLSLAHNFMAYLEVEKGRSAEAMSRLLQRAHAQKNDPEIFAGLVHACRYCGLLEASVAAWEQARRLDRSVRTSVMHTFFMMGDYQKAYEESGNETLGYMGPICLVALGREQEALALLEEQKPTPHHHITYLISLRALLQGRREESIQASERVLASGFGDPEGVYYLARHYVRQEEPKRAVELLGRVVERGYFCFSAMARDPWLDPLRADPTFNRILHTAEERYREAAATFAQLGGDRLLGLRVT